MGLEVVANDDPDAVFHRRYDAARKYALEGRKTTEWWYLQCEDMVAASRFHTKGANLEDWQAGVELSVSVVEDDAEVFHLKLLYLDMIAPLEPRIQPPPMNDLSEPEHRLFAV